MKEADLYILPVRQSYLKLGRIEHECRFKYTYNSTRSDYAYTEQPRPIMGVLFLYEKTSCKKSKFKK